MIDDYIYIYIYVDGLSITYCSNARQHIWTFASGHDEASLDEVALVLILLHILLHLLAVTIIVNQFLQIEVILTYIISMTHYGMEQDVQIIVVITLHNLGSIIN